MNDLPLCIKAISSRHSDNIIRYDNIIYIVKMKKNQVANHKKGAATMETENLNMSPLLLFNVKINN